MDYSKLTTNELLTVLKFHYLIVGTTLPVNWLDLIKTIKIEPGAAVAVELIDLYIATQLSNLKIEIPPELDMNNISSDYYSKLAPVLYLPPEFTTENLTRAQRIIRIIRDITKETRVTPTTTRIEIMPLQFIGGGKVGDFSWMIRRPEYNDVLFLFNDNESQFTQFINSVGKTTRPQAACSPGGGNAVIRPYQCESPPRAAGIPTGDLRGGYQNLKSAQPHIDLAFNYIRQLLETGLYKRVAYSAANDGRTLGTAIFSPSSEIKEYIVANIEALAK